MDKISVIVPVYVSSTSSSVNGAGTTDSTWLFELSITSTLLVFTSSVTVISTLLSISTLAGVICWLGIFNKLKLLITYHFFILKISFLCRNIFWFIR